MGEPYDVVPIAPRTCLDCGRAAAFRVVDTRKEHGERYPSPPRCKPCAKRVAAACNANIGNAIAKAARKP